MTRKPIEPGEVYGTVEVLFAVDGRYRVRCVCGCEHLAVKRDLVHIGRFNAGCQFCRNPGRDPDYVPTPAEIAAACREIQKSWSPQEERMRRGRREPDQWDVPVVQRAGWMRDVAQAVRE